MIIKVNKTGQTPLASVLLIPSKLFPYIGRTKHTLHRYPYPQLLFAQKLALSLRLCPKNAAQLRHYKPREKGAKHLCHRIEAVKLRHKYSAEQRVRLPLGHIRRKTLPLLEFMPITHIRITALSVKSFKEFHAHHSTLKRRKPSKSNPLLSPQP